MMKIVTTVCEARKHRIRALPPTSTVGLVPTMGYLHQVISVWSACEKRV